MSIQKIQHELQTLEYNLLAIGKNGKIMNNGGKLGQIQTYDNKFSQQKQNSNGNSENSFLKNKQFCESSDTANMNDIHLVETSELNKSQNEEQKENDTEQIQENPQICIASVKQEMDQECKIQQNNSSQQEEDDDEVEFEIVYEDSSDDQSKQIQVKEENIKVEEEKRQQRVNGINKSQNSKIRNKSSKKEVENQINKQEKNNKSSHQQNAQDILTPVKTKLIQEVKELDNKKKGDRSNNNHTQNIFQNIQNNEYNITRNRSGQKQPTSTNQKSQTIQSNDKQKKNSNQNSQITQKKQIGKVDAANKQGYNNDKNNNRSSIRSQNIKIDNEYQYKYLTSQKKKAVIDDKLESLGLNNLNRRKDTKSSSLYYQESESKLQDDDYTDNSEETDDNQKGNRGRQQTKHNYQMSRNNENSNQKVQQSKSHKKKIEQNSNETDDDSNSIDIPITLTKEQQTELLKYHKKSKNYHGTAKQFGITHEEARYVVKKLKKQSKSPLNN